MATALAILRSECRRAPSPAQVADHLAAELAPVLAPGQFLTLRLLVGGRKLVVFVIVVTVFLVVQNAVGVAAALGLLSLAATSDALAYCRTTSCGDKGTGEKCNPVGPADCGVPQHRRRKRQVVGHGAQHHGVAEPDVAELLGDLGVGAALRHQHQHFFFARGQPVDGLAGWSWRTVDEGRQQPWGDAGGDQRLTVGGGLSIPFDTFDQGGLDVSGKILFANVAAKL